jgi:hypothetical protein
MLVRFFWIICVLELFLVCGMQRFGNMAGVFLVMASAVRALDHSDAEHEFLRKIAKIATAEIVTSKVSDTVNISPLSLCF